MFIPKVDADGLPHINDGFSDEYDVALCTATSGKIEVYQLYFSNKKIFIPNKWLK